MTNDLTHGTALMEVKVKHLQMSDWFNFGPSRLFMTHLSLKNKMWPHHKCSSQIL
jgi:hypothetical protein